MPDDEEHAFLGTDRRQEFLAGDYDLDEAKDRQLKLRIEQDTQGALNDLITIAESPVIDTTKVFDTNDVGRLLDALFRPSQPHLEPDDITDDDFTHFSVPAKWTDEYRAYADSLYVRIDKTARPYRDGRFPDPRDS